jgi:hypothetical protein
MKFRDGYDQEENDRVAKEGMIDCTNDPGTTQQAPAEEQDINVIMKRFGVKDGSVIPYWPDPNAMFGDFSEMPQDAVEAAEYIRRGEVAFMTLPATLRRKFDSGAQLHNWLHNPENLDEAVTLGLLERREVSSSTSSDKVPLVPPTPKGE